MDWTDLLSAVALLMVLEGIMPFASPTSTRRTLALLSQMQDRSLRRVGGFSMIAGLMLLYFVRG
ncbi:MAG: DUF2065 domain-containing protein [Gammaproteobacteria bacterium]